MKYFLMLFILTASLHAQSAKVIALDDKDAAEAKSLYAQQADIANKLDILRKKILDRYASEDREDYSGGSGIITLCSINSVCTPAERPKDAPKRTYRVAKDGWNSSFQFSTDFKFIVPAPVSYYSGNGWSNCGSYITPVTTSPLTFVN